MGENFQELLLSKRSAIIKKWFLSLVDTYHPEASKFLKNTKNQFGNPMGYTYSSETEAIFDLLVKEQDPEKISGCLENIIKIRAVQDFTPSQAVDFVYALKRLIREELKNEIREEEVLREVMEFENRIDALALTAFDLYMACREKVYKIKEKETRINALQMLEAAGYRSGPPGKNPDFDGS